MIRRCLRCNDDFDEKGDYTSWICIWCWYDKLYKRTLADKYKYERKLNAIQGNDLAG